MQTNESRHKITDPALQEILERIEKDLVRREVPQLNSSMSNKSVVDSPVRTPSKSNVTSPREKEYSGIVDMPELSPTLDLTQPASLFGLSERFVAAESARYLASQFVKLQETINECLGEVEEEGGSAFEEYNTRTLGPLAAHLRRPLYYSTALRSINSEVILQLMSKVAWDIKDVKSQHSQYVEVMLKEIQIFSDRLGDVRRALPVTSEVRKVLWELCTLCASDLFVEG